MQKTAVVQKTIGCDIGGVLKTLTDRSLIPGGIAGIKSLSSTHRVVLISKTKHMNDPAKELFLRDNGIDYLEAHYCEKYEGKLELALQTGIDYMIDDRMQVLSILPPGVKKLWFCDDALEIAKWSKEAIFRELVIVKDWDEVLGYFNGEAESFPGP